MNKSITVFVSAFILLGLSLTPQTVSAWYTTVLPSEMTETPLVDWVVKKGDSLVVDTQNNIGYLVHIDGGYTSFRVATGQRKVVRYIGRTYNATTPVRRWEVTSKDIKGDHITFGKEGVFLRLYYKNESTSYGIHTHASAKEMLSEEVRFRSMGCIIVSQEMMHIIEETFEINIQSLQVVTTYGFGEDSVTYTTLKEIIENKA